MKLVSGYTDSAEQAEYRRRLASSASFMIDAAKTEISIISEEFRGIEDTIIDGIEDDETADWCLNFLADNKLKLAEAYRRLKYFRSEYKKSTEGQP